MNAWHILKKMCHHARLRVHGSRRLGTVSSGCGVSHKTVQNGGNDGSDRVKCRQF